MSEFRVILETLISLEIEVKLMDPSTISFKTIKVILSFFSKSFNKKSFFLKSRLILLFSK